MILVFISINNEKNAHDITLEKYVKKQQQLTERKTAILFFVFVQIYILHFLAAYSSILIMYVLEENYK